MSHHCCMLVRVVHVAEGCRGLKHPQTAPSTSISASPFEQTTFYTPLVVSGRDTNLNSHSLSEIPHADCGCSNPKAKWEHTAWHAIESVAQSPSQTWLLAPQFISITVKPLWYYFQCLDQWAASSWPPDLSELASSSEIFTDRAVRQFQLQVKWSLSCCIVNWVASLRTNTFSLQISSSLNLIMPCLFSAPPTALPLSCPHLPPIITRVESPENSGEGEVHQQMAP